MKRLLNKVFRFDTEDTEQPPQVEAPEPMETEPEPVQVEPEGPVYPWIEELPVDLLVCR